MSKKILKSGTFRNLEQIMSKKNCQSSYSISSYSSISRMRKNTYFRNSLLSDIIIYKKQFRLLMGNRDYVLVKNGRKLTASCKYNQILPEYQKVLNYILSLNSIIQMWRHELSKNNFSFFFLFFFIYSKTIVLYLCSVYQSCIIFGL